MLGGDVIFDNPIEYALRRTDSARDETGSYAPIFADLGPVLRAADLSIVNLEGPVADRAYRSADGEPPRFAAPRAFLAALADSGVDAVTVANNHAYDQGVHGLRQTLEALDALGLRYAGAAEGSTEAAAARYLEVRGHTIALLSFTEGTNFRPLEEEAVSPRVAIVDREAIARAVASARPRSDFVAIAYHWAEGREHVPSPRMRRYARLAADAGADLVFCHGTHRPAGTSVLRSDDGRSVPVLWSLGNLVAVMESSDDDVHAAEPSVRDAWLGRIALGASGERLEVRSVTAEPFWIGVSERADDGPWVRPLALALERRALDAREDCARCARLSRSYARRAARARELLALAAPDSTGSDRAIALLDEEEPEAAPIAERSLVSVTRVEPEPSAETPPAERGDAAPPSSSPAIAAAGAATAPSSRPASRARSEVVLRAELRIRWTGERALEAEVDRGQLAELAARLRADGELRLVIVAHPSSTADRGVWSRRAARARGLVAVLGPSRSRIGSEVGTAQSAPGLEALLVR